MMANVAWNVEESEQVYQWTGKYPALNCFDYIHLQSSAEGSWIDYGDITPVSQWWNNGGLVAAMWHWNVPTSNGSGNLTTYKDQTSFDIRQCFYRRDMGVPDCQCGFGKDCRLFETVERLQIYLSFGVHFMKLPVDGSGGAKMLIALSVYGSRCSITSRLRDLII